MIAALGALAAVTFFPRIWSPEHRLSDWMVTFTSPVKAVDRDIVLVTVRDDLAFRTRLVSLLPTDRIHLARLTECLSNAGARVIGFDMLFDWPDAQGMSEFESSLSESMARTPIIIGTVSQTGFNPQGQVDTAEIGRLAAASGVLTGVVDLVLSGSGGTVRTALGDRATTPGSVFATTVATSSGLPISNSRPLRAEEFRIAWFQGGEKLDGKSVRFSDFSSLDVVDLCQNQGASALSPIISDKIVLVGSRAQVDLHSVPLSTRSEYASGMSGLEIHATIVAQILRGPHIYVPGPLWSFLLAAVAALLGLIVHNSPRLAAWKKFVLIGLGFCITGLAWALYAFSHILLPVSLLLIALTNGAFIEQAARGVFNFWRRLSGMGQSTTNRGLEN